MHKKRRVKMCRSWDVDDALDFEDEAGLPPITTFMSILGCCSGVDDWASSDAWASSVEGLSLAELILGMR